MQTDFNTPSVANVTSYAGILPRIKAYVIDFCILLLVFVLAFNIIDFIGDY